MWHRKKEYVLYHDKLKTCKVSNIPLSLCKLHHNLLDLDSTIAYGEVEQEDPALAPLDQLKNQGLSP